MESHRLKVTAGPIKLFEGISILLPTPEPLDGKAQAILHAQDRFGQVPYFIPGFNLYFGSHVPDADPFSNFGQFSDRATNRPAQEPGNNDNP
jgi:hypothetical protein